MSLVLLSNPNHGIVQQEIKVIIEFDLNSIGHQRKYGYIEWNAHPPTES